MRYRRYSHWDYFPRYPKSQPRAAKGGIKAQTKRGAFGQSWWAKRWIAVLESFDIGARLGRGRSYARNGQVLAIDVQEGKVTAKVQGSRPQPYEVKIEVKVLAAEEWKQVLRALSGQALFVAKLLAGEMPQDIEEVFKAAKLSLFPQKQADLKTACSCPDWSNPCKHIAAVYYLLGEEFDRDPFLLFRLRGLGRDGLLERLGGLTPAAARRQPRPKLRRRPSPPRRCRPTRARSGRGAACRTTCSARWRRRRCRRRGYSGWATSPSGAATPICWTRWSRCMRRRRGGGWTPSWEGKRVRSRGSECRAAGPPSRR